MTVATRGVTLRPLDLATDLEMLHAWVTHPRAVFWMMQGASLDDVRAEYASVVASEHHHAWWGSVDGTAAFLAETYDPAHSPLAAHYPVQPGDLGMHVLVAPTETPVHGFTSRVFAAVVQHCFARTGSGDVPTRRVVVEPDVGNQPIAELNARAGFLVEKEIDLPEKRAALSVCTRARFDQSPLRRSTSKEELA
ncbi:acetyltransferase [Aeromicrobium sp. Root495]|uniref:GNAT family N-acetyltransferase n=1 Tax=Aeromicrobium sp. Root495 TaxID=1736550 RepID=UPI0006FD3955|nr:GNAT family N-acetyltransferase [Aeromicrobium sp. Root495]KQY60460.1 acetyltransferase [Aeromicrobium sp. Root495]